MNVYARVLAGLGRIFLSLIFIATAMSEIFAWDQAEKDLSFAFTNWELYTSHTENIGNFFTSMLGVSSVLLIASIALQLIGGIFLFSGYRVRFAAFLLFIYLLAATLVYQPFWFLEGPAYSRSMVLFLNNTAIMGGLITVMSMGKGTGHWAPPPSFKKKANKDEKLND